MIQSFRQRLLKQFILLSVSLGIPLLICLIVLSSMVPRARISTLSQATAAQISENLSTNVGLELISLNPGYSVQGHKLQTQPMFVQIASKAKDALVKRTRNEYFRELLRDHIAHEIQLVMISADMSAESLVGTVVAALDSDKIGDTFNYALYEDEQITPSSSQVNIGTYGDKWTAFSPVFNLNQETVAMVVVHSDAGLINWLDWSGVAFAFVLVGSVIGLSIYFASKVSRRIYHPIKSLHEGMLELASGHLGVKVASHQTGDEFDDLIRHFNQTSQQLKERMTMLNAMEMAAEIQSKLLPDEIPEIHRYDLSATLQYAELAGGDYYDFILLTDENAANKKWLLVVGDVTGHGVSAALLVAWLRATVRLLARECGGALALLSRRLNASMLQDMNTGKFVTLFFAIVESDNNKLNWLSAGHDPARLYTGQLEAPKLLDATGPPIGVVADASWHQGDEIVFNDDDVLLIMTDGLQDAKNPTGQRLGADAIDQCMKSNQVKSAKGAQQALIERMDVHRTGANLADDVTLMIVKRQP